MKKYTEIEVLGLTIKTVHEADCWCEEFVGLYGRNEAGDIENWMIRYGPYHGDRVYIFAREEDAMLFALKWR